MGLEFTGINVTHKKAPDRLEYIIYPNQGKHSYDTWYPFDSFGNIYIDKQKEFKNTRNFFVKLEELQFKINSYFLGRKKANKTIIVVK